MTNRIISGTVNRDGSIKYGSEFSVTRTREGHYLVAFRPAFTQISGAAVTQIYPNDGSTLDNAVILDLKGTELNLKTGDGGGNAQDRDFTFVATGVGSAPGAA